LGIFDNPNVTLGLMGSTLILFCLLVCFILYSKGPAMTFLLAKLKSKSVLITVGRDRMATMEAVKYRHGAVYSKAGYFGVAQNSVYVERRSRVPLMLAYDQLAISLDPKLVAAIEELKSYDIPYIVEKINDKGELVYEEKHKINTIQELQQFLIFAERHRESIEINGMDQKTRTAHLNECISCTLFESGISLPYDTVDIQNISQWINKNINPSFVEGLVINEVKSKLLATQRLDVKWLVYLPALVIAAGVAVLIISQLMAAPPSIPNVVAP
tara:strand:- start:1030 stop:1842 length:813 start_codon:yes stop_codon:yes gene_type:complete